MALGEMGLAFEREPLRKVWDRALQLVELPSTRTLLHNAARLSDLLADPTDPRRLLAVVTVRADWLEMAESRRQLLAVALADALGMPVRVELQGVQL